MLTVSEQMCQEINQGLENMGLAALSSDNTASLMGQLQDIACKDNCVRSVIGECAWGVGVRTLWREVDSSPVSQLLDHLTGTVATGQVAVWALVFRNAGLKHLF